MDPVAAFSLQNILGEDHENIQHPSIEVDVDNEEKPPPEGFCVECEDQPAEVLCQTCEDKYCQVCFDAQHRKGSRKRHATTPLDTYREAKVKKVENGDQMIVQQEDSDDETWDKVIDAPAPPEVIGAAPAIGAKVGEFFVQSAKYLPLRLTPAERKLLRLLEAALSVSEYTDKIDILGHNLSKAKRIVAQIRELCSIMSGLLLSCDYARGQELFSERDFHTNSEFYQMIFELGRRHKIMNPEKMRSTYGKLIFLLQDSQTPEVKGLLDFSCVRPIKTVYSVLDEHGGLDLLRDDLITVATKEIYAEGRMRRDIQKDIKSKERAIETLASRYERKNLSQDTIRQCLYSIGDNQSFLRTNRDPCEKMIFYLKKYFHPTEAKTSKTSLAIRSGKNGARLTHSHETQYGYALQSLTLWREILNDMFQLWSLAEQDLLSETVPYRLRDTGQGLNRVQAAPRTARKMNAILTLAQKNIGRWIGSSVIHMGDTAVPSSFHFIDKYTQIYRILLPVCNTLNSIPRIMANPSLRSYVEDEFGSEENLILEILGDFYRHALDGSGADNFFDAGSCIDGRLTSAWNWCSQLEKKRYFPVFLLTGFTGFDGEW